MTLKILIFNWHEPYLCLLSRIGHEFFVVEPEIAPGQFRFWDRNMRPLPSNARLITPNQARALLDEGAIDLGIALNLKDLIHWRDYEIPKIIVFLNRLTTELGLSQTPIRREEYLTKIQSLFQDADKVFISESKKRDWGMDGSVILTGLDIEDYGGYTGEWERVLRVGNLLRERDLMMGFSTSEQILAGFPSITLGQNPEIAGSRLSRGFDDLLEHFRKCRLYLNTTVDGYEDGYNMAMLEAMATGMPVISMFNETSPIENGVNGYQSRDLDFLRDQAHELLQNPSLARSLGKEARETVREKFPLSGFLESWRSAIDKTIARFLERHGVSGRPGGKVVESTHRKNILMDYVSYPATTGFYLERALRKSNNVITCGAMITEEVIRAWNLEALPQRPQPQDVPRGPGKPLADVLKKLPPGWTPDFYLWVETGLDAPPPDLAEHSLPKVCYLIDTHVHLERHIQIAAQFDFVFLAQKAYVEVLNSSGCTNVAWLPLACDPDIHGKKEGDKCYDVGFVGTVASPVHDRRNRLLDAVGSRFNLCCDRRFLEEMAELYSRSKIIFNNAFNGDLNMRVFEALCSGSLLVTDPVRGSGLEEFFKDRKHLVLYEDDSLVEIIRYYLEHPEERERIAEDGRNEVLQHHTYEHRVRTMIQTLAPVLEKSGKPAGAVDRQDPYFLNVRHDILPLIPQKASCILEVGCAAGGTGAELKKRPGVFVAGVERDPVVAQAAREVLDDVVEGNIESLNLPYAEKSFDCILFADVLEHLLDPLSVLRKIKPHLKPGGTVVASIPNVQYFGLIHHLVEGNWTYQKEGILDETHLRFFTFREIEKLFAEAGFEIVQVDETLNPQFQKAQHNPSRTLRLGRITIHDLSPEEMKRFFVFQYKVVAKPVAPSPARPNAFSTVGHLSKTARTRMLHEAGLREKEKDFAGALSGYQEILNRFPDCVEAVVRQANCQMHLRKPVEARRLYRQAVDMDSGNAEGWKGLGLVELQEGNAESASQYLLKALQIQPQNEKVLSGLALVNRLQGDNNKAMKYCLQILHGNLENQQAIKLLLELSYELGEFEASENVLTRYLELHPADLDLLFALAGVQFKMNQMDRAKKTLDRILLFDPRREDAHQLMQKVEADLSAVK